ncbi:MAG: ABC transporter substrate-binding protein [Bacteroidetes bacterium HGW-Bacteroidetes-21]|nr:MAG: ABC transporter substrate-binding protein [Bacteroidetes bacterium HGW-Bacteroidetes-21]
MKRHTMLLKISNIAYLNTLPFRYGLRHYSFPKKYSIEVSEDIPSVCARKIMNNEANIGIIPVGALPQFDEYQIISNYCIASFNKVESVKLFAKKDLRHLKRIYLDYHSMTSVKLLQYLAKYKWKIDVEWLPASEGYEKEIHGDTGGLIIGDRALLMNPDFSFSYDLAEEWKEYTGRPFVFAVWIAKKMPDPDFIQAFNEALKTGVDQIDKAIKDYPTPLNIDISYYLHQNIYYHYTPEMKESVDFFLKSAF